MTDTLLSTFPDSFKSKVEVLDSGCWLWTRSKSKAGYGFYQPRGEKLQNAHRWAWKRLHGPLPSSVHLDHYRHPDQGCIGPSCANPDHVRPATPRENTLRSKAPSSSNLAKTRCVNGHEFTPENTKYDKHGRRRCLACSRERDGYKGNPLNGTQTHCRNGHEFTSENTAIRPSTGQRECRSCNREKSRRRRAKAT